jgi:hypothetical protein
MRENNSGDAVRRSCAHVAPWRSRRGGIALAVLAATVPAHAEPAPREEPVVERLVGRAGASHVLEQTIIGAARPWTFAARHVDGAIVTATRFAHGGPGETTFGLHVEASVFPRVTLIGIASSEERSELVRPALGVAYDLVRGERFDAGLALAFESSTPSGVASAVARLALAGRFGVTHVIANLALGAGLDGEERHGDLRVAATRPVWRTLHVGLDSRLRADLELDDDEPEGEREWDIHAGPVATYAIQRFALSAGTGVVAWKLRHDPRVTTGLAVMFGAGATF